MWYEAIRKRCSSVVLQYTDEELEEGIKELEEEFGDRDVLKFDIAMQGVIMTKT